MQFTSIPQEFDERWENPIENLIGNESDGGMKYQKKMSLSGSELCSYFLLSDGTDWSWQSIFENSIILSIMKTQIKLSENHLIVRFIRHKLWFIEALFFFIHLELIWCGKILVAIDLEREVELKLNSSLTSHIELQTGSCWRRS